MRIKNNPKRLLAFISKKHYGAYDNMIDQMRPLLVTPDQSSWLIERLEFRTDLNWGSKKLIYQAIARLLAAAPDGKVLARGFKATDLFRWLADPAHSNLDIHWQSLQRLVYQELRSEINK